MRACFCYLLKESEVEEPIRNTCAIYSVVFVSFMLRVLENAPPQRLVLYDAGVIVALLLPSMLFGCILDMITK